MTKMDENKILSENDVKKIVEEQINIYIKITKFFLFGLLGFFIIGFGSGIILPKNIIRLIHDSVFESEKIIMTKIGKGIQSEVGVSYHRSFLLHSPDQREEIMLFFAEKGQKVKVYVETSHYGTSLEKRKLFVELDNQIIWGKIEDFEGGFKDITDKVFPKKKQPPFREENVHSLEFSLDDTQPVNIDDIVFVDCVIIVFGKFSNNNE